MSKAAAPDLQKVLDNPNSTTIDVLKCPTINNDFRKSDPKLMEFLLQPQHFKDILDILTKTHMRSDHKRVLTLFQTSSNTSLNRVFSESIPLTEYAFQSVSKDDDQSLYASGTISRIFTNSLDHWPEEIYDVFHYSDTLYLILINNFHKSSVYRTIVESLEAASEVAGEFTWFLFLALVKTQNEASNNQNQSKTEKFDHPPRCCFLSKDIYPQLTPFPTDVHISNSIKFIKEYFELKKPNQEDFAENVFTFIMKQINAKVDFDKIYFPLYIELAKSLGYNSEFQQLMINLIKQAASLPYEDTSCCSLSSSLITAAISYLEICTDHLDKQTSCSLIATLIDKRISQFGLLSMVTIANKIVLTQPTWVQEFRNLVCKLIACSWNLYHADKPLLVSILFDLSIKLQVEKETGSKQFEGAITAWKKPDFLLSSVNVNEPILNTGFSYESSVYDINQLNSLRWGQPFV